MNLTSLILAGLFAG